MLWADLAQRYRNELRRLFRCASSVCCLRGGQRSSACTSARPSISDREARWTYDAQLALTDFDLNIDNSDLSPEQAAQQLAAYRDERSGSGTSAE